MSKFANFGLGKLNFFNGNIEHQKFFTPRSSVTRLGEDCAMAAPMCKQQQPQPHKQRQPNNAVHRAGGGEGGGGGGGGSRVAVEKAKNTTTTTGGGVSVGQTHKRLKNDKKHKKIAERSQSQPQRNGNGNNNNKNDSSNNNNKRNKTNARHYKPNDTIGIRKHQWPDNYVVITASGEHMSHTHRNEHSAHGWLGQSTELIYTKDGDSHDADTKWIMRPRGLKSDSAESTTTTSESRFTTPMDYSSKRSINAVTELDAADAADAAATLSKTQFKLLPVTRRMRYHEKGFEKLHRELRDKQHRNMLNISELSDLNNWVQSQTVYTDAKHTARIDSYDSRNVNKNKNDDNNSSSSNNNNDSVSRNNTKYATSKSNSTQLSTQRKNVEVNIDVNVNAIDSITHISQRASSLSAVYIVTRGSSNRLLEVSSQRIMSQEEQQQAQTHLQRQQRRIRAQKRNIKMQQAEAMELQKQQKKQEQQQLQPQYKQKPNERQQQQQQQQLENSKHVSLLQKDEKLSINATTTTNTTNSSSYNNETANNLQNLKYAEKMSLQIQNKTTITAATPTPTILQLSTLPIKSKSATVTSRTATVTPLLRLQHQQQQQHSPLTETEKKTLTKSSSHNKTKKLSQRQHILQQLKQQQCNNTTTNVGTLVKCIGGRIIRKSQHKIPLTIQDGIDDSYYHFVSTRLNGRYSGPPNIRYLYRPMVRQLNKPKSQKSKAKKGKNKMFDITEPPSTSSIDAYSNIIKTPEQILLKANNKLQCAATTTTTSTSTYDIDNNPNVLLETTSIPYSAAEAYENYMREAMPVLKVDAKYMSYMQKLSQMPYPKENQRIRRMLPKRSFALPATERLKTNDTNTKNNTKQTLPVKNNNNNNNQTFNNNNNNNFANNQNNVINTTDNHNANEGKLSIMRPIPHPTVKLNDYINSNGNTMMPITNHGNATATRLLLPSGAKLCFHEPINLTTNYMPAHYSYRRRAVGGCEYLKRISSYVKHNSSNIKNNNNNNNNKNTKWNNINYEPKVEHTSQIAEQKCHGNILEHIVEFDPQHLKREFGEPKKYDALMQSKHKFQTSLQQQRKLRKNKRKHKKSTNVHTAAAAATATAKKINKKKKKRQHKKSAARSRTKKTHK